MIGIATEYAHATFVHVSSAELKCTLTLCVSYSFSVDVWKSKLTKSTINTS